MVISNMDRLSTEKEIYDEVERYKNGLRYIHSFCVSLGNLQSFCCYCSRFYDGDERSYGSCRIFGYAMAPKLGWFYLWALSLVC